MSPVVPVDSKNIQDHIMLFKVLFLAMSMLIKTMSMLIKTFMSIML